MRFKLTVLLCIVFLAMTDLSSRVQAAASSVMPKTSPVYRSPSPAPNINQLLSFGVWVPIDDADKVDAEYIKKLQEDPAQKLVAEIKRKTELELKRSLNGKISDKWRFGLRIELPPGQSIYQIIMAGERIRDKYTVTHPPVIFLQGSTVEAISKMLANDFALFVLYAPQSIPTLPADKVVP